MSDERGFIPEEETNSSSRQNNVNDGTYHYGRQYYEEHKTDGNFSQFRDPVEEDIPKVEAEPAYSPYSNQDYSQNTYYSAPQNSDQEPEKKKKSKGFKGFMIAVVAIIVCVALLIGIYPKLAGNKNDNPSVKGDDTTLNISDVPSIDKSSESL